MNANQLKGKAMQFKCDLNPESSIRQPVFVARPVFPIFGSMTPLLKKFGIIAAVLCLLAVAGLFFVNRQLPTFIARALNAHVEGYRFTVGQATLSPVLSLEIRQLTMIQTDHPDPPVAEIPRWRLSIQWRHILSGVLVSDYAWQGRIGENIYWGAWTIGPWDLHPLVLLFVLSGTLMVSKTLHIPKF